MQLLEIRNLTKAFGGQIAVKNVSLDIKQGEIVGLIGPNGAGKTTLFNLITGLYSPDAGIIAFEGEDIAGLKPFQICRRGISRTFQIARPFAQMNVLDNVIVGALSRETDMKKCGEKAIEALDFCGLLEKKDTLAKELTIAYRKRLGLASALATEPKLLLIDEIVAGLNPRETNDVILLINKLHDQGLTILLVEHVMKVITAISDRIIVLNFGEKIAEGEAKKIVTDEKVIKAYLGDEYVPA